MEDAGMLKVLDQPQAIAYRGLASLALPHRLMWKCTTMKVQACVVAVHPSLPLGKQASVEQTGVVTAKEATCITCVSFNINLIQLLIRFCPNAETVSMRSRL